MNFKYLAAVLLFVALVPYVVSDTGYVQRSSNPPGSCVELDCNPTDNGLKKCERRYIAADGQAQSDVFYLKRTASNIYDIVDKDGVPSGKTYILETNNSVVRVTVQDESGNFVRSVCITDARQPTDDEQNTMATFCPKEEMKEIDNTNCSS